MIGRATKHLSRYLNLIPDQHCRDSSWKIAVPGRIQILTNMPWS
jgi:hypothetical protein